jgi:hypothetical protein
MRRAFAAVAAAVRFLFGSGDMGIYADVMFPEF